MNTLNEYVQELLKNKIPCSDLRKLKKRYLEFLHEMQTLNIDEFNKIYPRNTYTQDDVKFLIKTINYKIKVLNNAKGTPKKFDMPCTQGVGTTL